MKKQVNQPKSSNVAIEQISVDKLDGIIAEGRFTIIDVRDPKGIYSQGSIPGAINIPIEAIDQALVINDAVFGGGGPFVFCCTGGVMSYMAAIKAQESGLKDVYNLEGGHSAWMKHKMALAEG